MTPEERTFIKQTLTIALRAGHCRELYASMLKDASNAGDVAKIQALRDAAVAAKYVPEGR